VPLVNPTVVQQLRKGLRKAAGISGRSRDFVKTWEESLLGEMERLRRRDAHRLHKLLKQYCPDLGTTQGARPTAPCTY
jgi:hypothetical protein